MQPRRTVQLPRPGLFAGGLTLYGRPPSGADAPSAADLGCTVTRPGGQTRKPFDMAWVDHREQTVDGRRLAPLLSVPRNPTGATLTCSGPAATDAAPLYLLSGGLDAGLMRVMLLVFAALGLVVGTTTVLVLRPRG